MSVTSPWPEEIEREMTPGVRAFFEAQRLAWQKRIDELESRVAQLERELRRHEKFRRPNKPEPSATSEPSTLPPPSTKKRGGQPGHPKAERALIPTEQCHEVIACRPPVCRGCGEELSGSDPEPWRHQVTEIPPIVPRITEYQRHRLRCSCCGVTTCGTLPEGVPSGMTGPRLTALVGLLMALFRQSKRRVSLFCETALGISVSPGLVIKLQNLVTESTQPAYDELVQSLPEQPAVNVDETPTRQQNRNAWIWTIVSQSGTVFAVRLTKAATVINDLLGPDFAGVITSDRAKMYDHFQRHQVCWAHLKRDFEALAQSETKTAAKLGRELSDLTDQVFHHWHRVRDGTVQRPAFLRHVRRLQGRFYLAFEEGLACAETAGICDNLLQKFDTLFEFTRSTTHAIEPTNNAAERSLRHAVIWKHLSFGTQSARGSRFVETLLSVVETCRQQGRDLLDFLYQSLSRHLQGLTGPSLLPNGA